MNSFDFYNTLVTRDVFDPKDIFYFVGVHVNGRGLIEIAPSSFLEFRVRSEILARQESNKEEVNIGDIYFFLEKALSINRETGNAIKAIELEFEFKTLTPIRENCKKIKSTDIIISDTYLDKQTIKSFLHSHKIAYKELFVSSEYERMKHFGSLYDEVLQKHANFTHWGDNYHSDYEMAMSKNIPSVHYKKSIPTIYEQIIYKDKQIPFSVRTVMAGVMKSARLSKYYDNEHKNTIHEVGSNVVGPLLFLYTHWLLKEAIAQGLDTLYFVARDGDILYKIAKQILRHEKKHRTKITIKYLYGSRKAWHLPSVTQIDSSVMDWIFDDTKFLSVNDVCNRVDINVNKIKEELIGFENLQNNLLSIDRKRLKLLFQNSKKIHNLILNKAKEKRKLVVKYLKQEGFDKSKKIGIVDVGWRGRQQSSLSKILNSQKLYPKDGIVGFYLALRNPVIPYKNDSFNVFFELKRYHSIIFYSALYEIFVASDQGSCIGYKNNFDSICPVLREKNNNHMIQWGIRIHQNSVLNFSNLLLNSIHNYDLEIKENRRISGLLLEHFFHFPSIQEAMCYGEIRIFEDQEEAKATNLCVKLTYCDLFIKNRGKKCHNLWIEGAIAISFSRKLSQFFLFLKDKRQKTKDKKLF